MHFLLLGNYGVGNLGDELLRGYFLQRFPEVQWTVVSASPQAGEVPRLPFGVRSLFMTPWWRTLRALWMCDGVVFGGGSLFTDVESVYACLLWRWHALWAQLLGKPVLLAFQGIGPFRTRVGERCARAVCRSAVFISVRDRVSEERCRSWELHTKIVQSFDPVFSLIAEENTSSGSKNVLMIIPRKNSSRNFLPTLRDVLKNSSFTAVLILSFEPDNPEEQWRCTELKNDVGVSAEILPMRDLPSLVYALGAGSTVITQRFHGAVAALALGKTLYRVPQVAGDKIDVLPESVSPEEHARLLIAVRTGEDALREAMNKVQ